MVRYNPTVLERPSSINEAAQLLKKWGSKARIVAGNTTIYELANQGGLDDVDTVIDLSKLNLNYITRYDGSLHIGAMTRFVELASSNLTGNDSYFAAKEAAMKLTPPQIRNMATIGGSACSGIPFYDMPVTLLAIDAEFHATSSDEGERTIKAEDFFIDYFVTTLRAEELLTEIVCPNKERSSSSFVKLGRTTIDFALVNAAVNITLEPKRNRMSEVRIALGAVAATPIRAKSAEDFLIGQEPSRENIIKAASLGLDFEPSPSLHASSKYKKRVIPILVRDALFAAVNRVLRT